MIPHQTVADAFFCLITFYDSVILNKILPYFFFYIGHGSIASIMSSRLKNLNTVARYWGDGDIKVSNENHSWSFKLNFLYNRELLQISTD